MIRWFKPVVVLTLLALTVPASTAYAQRDAGAKLRGEYGFYGGGAGTALRSARESSATYQQYGKSTQTVNPQVARDAADTIGTYITKANAHFAYMRKQAQAASDKDTLTALDSIDKHLAAAAKSHAEMKETCLKDHVEGAPVMECCKHIDNHLAAAIAEHDKLMKKLAGNKAAPSQK